MRSVQILSKPIAQNYVLFFIVGLILELAFLSPIVFKGENAYIRYHEVLDQKISRLKAMKDLDLLLSWNPNEVVETVHGGTLRGHMVSNLYVDTWLNSIFSSITSYLISFSLVHILAYIGMFVLLKTYIIKGETWIYTSIALVFSFTGFFEVYGITVAGLPLVLYAVLNLQHGKRLLLSYLILGFFPFYSLLSLMGVFLSGFLGLYIVVLWYMTKSVNLKLVKGWGILICSYLLNNYQLLYLQYVRKPFIPHRTEFRIPEESFTGVMNNTREVFFDLIPHIGNRPVWIVVMVFFGIIIGTAVKHEKVKFLYALLFCNIVLSFTYAFYFWEGLVSLKESITFLRIFQWNRVVFFSQLIWYISFAYTLVIVKDLLKPINWAIWVVPFSIIYQGAYNLRSNPEFNHNISALYSSKPQGASIGKFYAEQQFKRIKGLIEKKFPGESNMSMVGLGIFPTVLHYNGIKALDGYSTLYDLEYKKQFRKIISKELEKNNGLKRYYDDWGSRCYLYSSEIGREMKKTMQGPKQLKSIRNLDISIDQLRSMECKYIVSAVEIKNSETLGVNLVSDFQDKSSAWHIWLYRIP